MQGCHRCQYLKVKDKKDGKSGGSVYLCSKTKKYVNGATDVCDKFSKDPCRKAYESDEIYENGKKFSNETRDPSTYLVIAIILIIIAIIVNVF